MDSAPASERSAGFAADDRSSGTDDRSSGADDPSSGAVYLSPTVRTSVKLLVVGHFAAGKTTFVRTMSEIKPLHTEEIMTEAGAPVDDLTGVPDKATTTVAMDFGRLTLNDELVLYLFGTPGQHRFTRLWQDMTTGALGALVIADTRRLDQSFEVMGLLEDHGLPYAVALNQFPDAPRYTDDEVREALDLLPDTPLIACDARDRRSSAEALIALVGHLLTLSGQEPPP